MVPPSDPARYLMSAFACGVAFSIIATSPAPWMAPLLALSAAGAGNEKKSKHGLLAGLAVHAAPPAPVVPGL